MNKKAQKELLELWEAMSMIENLTKEEKKENFFNLYRQIFGYQIIIFFDNLKG